MSITQPPGKSPFLFKALERSVCIFYANPYDFALDQVIFCFYNIDTCACPVWSTEGTKRCQHVEKHVEHVEHCKNTNSEWACPIPNSESAPPADESRGISVPPIYAHLIVPRPRLLPRAEKRERNVTHSPRASQPCQPRASRRERKVSRRTHRAAVIADRVACSRRPIPGTA